MPTIMLISLLGLSLTAAGIVNLLSPAGESRSLSGVFEFGTRALGDVVEHSIRFVPESDDTIEVVRTGCGCSTVGLKVPHRVYAGKEVAIPVRVRLLKPDDRFRVMVRLMFSSKTIRDFEMRGKVVPKAQP